VATAANLRELLIKEGTVYFAVSKMSHSLNFFTPSGNLAVLDILLNAAAGGPQLKGYVAVKPNGSELGVLEGGSMIVSTQQGEMMIKSGQRLILGQAELDVGAPEEIETSDETEGKEEAEAKEETEGKEEKAGMSKNQKIILGAIGVVAVAAGVGALAGGGGGGGGGGSDGGGSISPSSP